MKTIGHFVTKRTENPNGLGAAKSFATIIVHIQKILIFGANKQ